jgi:hypothetical protein
MTIQLSSQRTFGTYDDLASATARLQAGPYADTQSVLAGLAFISPTVTVGAVLLAWILWREDRRTLATLAGEAAARDDDHALADGS